MFLMNSQFLYVYRHLSVDKLFRIKLIRFAALLLLICLSPNLMFSYPGGVTGRTLITVSTGCGSCHGSSASTSVVVTIDGPSTLQVNQTGLYSNCRRCSRNNGWSRYSCLRRDSRSRFKLSDVGKRRADK